MTQNPRTRASTHALALLREDHRRMQQLLDECGRAEPPARKAIADNLIAQTHRHIQVTQEFLLPAVERISHDVSVVDSARRHSGEIDRLAKEMAETSGEDPRFPELHDRMRQHVSQHTASEERNIFPQLEAIGEEELVSMGEKMAARREETPLD